MLVSIALGLIAALLASVVVALLLTRASRPIASGACAPNEASTVGMSLSADDPMHDVVGFDTCFTEAFVSLQLPGDATPDGTATVRSGATTVLPINIADLVIRAQEGGGDFGYFSETLPAPVRIARGSTVSLDLRNCNRCEQLFVHLSGSPLQPRRPASSRLRSAFVVL